MLIVEKMQDGDIFSCKKIKKGIAERAKIW